MKNVTSRTSNPFGMDPPCPESGGDHDAVFGYGDANADIHVVGDNPSVHGGCDTGVPFTGTDAGERVLDVLETVGLAERTGTDDGPSLSNCFLSYRYLCCRGDGDEDHPTAGDYDAFERFFDAELRAIGAHVLVPVGQRATAHVLGTYTARDPDQAVADRHGEVLHGSGFLVVSLSDPAEWTDGDAATAVDALAELLASDYTQHADLGRFVPGGDPYFVR
ncbi:MAG: uracil-DNA glycosylase family protein [Haloarculaceae archaeon]